MERVRSCSFIWKEPFTLPGAWPKAAETLGSPLPGGGWIWLILLTAALVIGLWAMFRKPTTTEQIANDDRLLFALMALLLGMICYAGFLRVLSYSTKPWYYVVLVAFVATCVEMIVSSAKRKENALLTRSACSLLLMGASFVPALHWLEDRQTNIDIIAAKLAKTTTPDDLIVINPWIYGISFRHYYHGATPYVTFPPMKDLRTHRVDIAKRQMMSVQPMAPVLRRMAEVLQAGHTVWLIGGLNYVSPGRRPLFVRPGFDSPDGWVGGDYITAWSEQGSFLVQTYAKTLMPIPVPCDQPVVPYEDPPLTAIRGWRSGTGHLEVIETAASRLSKPINPSSP
jgi:Ca2+/Na+ antiporter